MKTRNVALALTLSAGLFVGGAALSPVSAQSLAQGGTSYGCTINPNAPGCATTSSTGANSPPALPQTGGGAPASPALPLGDLAAGVALLVLGAGLRRASRR